MKKIFASILGAALMLAPVVATAATNPAAKLSLTQSSVAVQSEDRDTNGALLLVLGGIALVVLIALVATGGGDDESPVSP